MLKSIETDCTNCQKSNNKYDKICVVEDIADQWSIESSSIFQGYYHILGGTINNSNNQNKSELLVESLIKRVEEKKIEEVILATSATIEGQTTAFYIQDSLHSTGVKITKLAQGLPIGGEIESLDDPVAKYLPQFNDDRNSITLRNILNMRSGLEFPEDEHERMFLYPNQLEYSLSMYQSRISQALYGSIIMSTQCCLVIF